MKQSVKLVAGNWKMNGLGASLGEAEALAKALQRAVGQDQRERAGQTGNGHRQGEQFFKQARPA